MPFLRPNSPDNDVGWAQPREGSTDNKIFLLGVLQSKTLLSPHDLSRRRGRRGGEEASKRARKHGGADPTRAVRLPQPAVLPGDGRRQPLPARRQAPRGPRLLQPAPREGWWQEDGAEIRPGQVLAVSWGTTIRSSAAHPLSRWNSASTSNASYGPEGRPS